MDLSDRDQLHLLMDESERTGVSVPWSAGANFAQDARVSGRPGRRGSSNLVAKIRTRSLSIGARGGRKSSSHSVNNNIDPADIQPPESAAGKATPGQISDIIEKHQRAMMTDMIGLLQSHEKEIKFWKNKAMKTNNSNTSHGSSGSSVLQFMAKVSILEKEVANRDILIESLRKSMEVQEKASEERELRLEHQLEKLVEVETKVATDPNILNEKPRQDKVNKKGKGPAYEISTLEQLLARVLAEKDKLLVENQNLLALMKRMKSTPASAPPQTNGHTVSPASSPPINPSASPRGVVEHVQDDTFRSYSDNVEDDSHESSPKDPSNDENRVLYQLSCRNCQKNHNHVKYMGACDGHGIDAQVNLKRALEKHFAEVWKIVRNADDGASITSDVHRDEWMNREDSSNDWMDSSLARHIASRHCQKFSNEVDVSNWCMDNVRVEMMLGASASSPPASTSSSKENKKSKKGMKKNKKEGLLDRSFR